MRTLAIIPARGGSKRLPRKNVLDLGGKPMIAWSIEAALGCVSIDEVLVSTDNNGIAEVAKQYGARVPFMRPNKLASDTATSVDVVRHAINFYKDELGMQFDLVVLLQPTSPLRNSSNITAAFELLKERNADAVISVCEADHSPLWMNTLPGDLNMCGFVKSALRNTRSQDIPKYYRLNGAIYICSTARLEKEKTFLISDNIYAYIMSKHSSVDVDDQLDFSFASFLMQLNDSKLHEANKA